MVIFYSHVSLPEGILCSMTSRKINVRATLGFLAVVIASVLAHDGPSPFVIVVSVAHPPQSSTPTLHLPCLWLLNTPEISLLGKLLQLQGVENQSKTCSAANIHGNTTSHQEKNIEKPSVRR